MVDDRRGEVVDVWRGEWWMIMEGVGDDKEGESGG